MKSFLSKSLSVLLSVSFLLGSSGIVVSSAQTTPGSINEGLTDEQVIANEYKAAAANGQTDLSGLVEGEDYAPGEVIVCVKESVVKGKTTQTESGKIEDEYDVTVSETLDDSMDTASQKGKRSGEAEILYLANTDSDIPSLCEELAQEDSVVYAQPNYAYEPCEVEQSYSEKALGVSDFVLPQETGSSLDYYNNQKWWMDMLKVEEAWQYTGGAMGKDVVVSVIDSGCNTAHEELQGHFWQYEKDSSVCGYYAFGNSWIRVGNNSLCYDAHGTHTSGSVAMANNSSGYLGTGCESKLMVMKADRNDGGSFYSSEIIECVQKSVELGADVISMSYGSYDFDMASLAAYQKAAKDAVLIAAAGNDKFDTTQKLHFPSAYSCIIGVMATGDKKNSRKLASFSNYDTTGNFYKVAAPGTSIYSCSNTDNKGYKVMSGTSMATPIVSGLTASYISYIRSLGLNWSASQFQYMIENTLNEKGNTLCATAYSKSNHTAAYNNSSRFKMFDLLYLVKNGTDCPAPKEVAIDNKDLRNAVLAHTGLTSLTQFDVSRIAYIDMDNLSVSAIKELLEKFDSLEWFDIHNCPAAKDYIKQNGADDFLRALPDTLAYLNLKGSYVKDISALEDGDFTALNVLDVSSNPYLKDISVLGKYTALRYLSIGSTSVSDITAVGSMPYLYKLDASSCSIYSIVPLSGMAKISVCNLSSNKITNISPLFMFAGTNLNLDNNYICEEYSPDYENTLKNIRERMESANDEAVSLTYDSQKTLPQTMTQSASFTMDSELTLTRAQFAGKSLSELANVRVYDEFGNQPKINSDVMWSFVSGYCDGYNGITTRYANLIAQTRSVKFTASLISEESFSTKSVNIKIVAPELVSASLAYDNCGDLMYILSARTNAAADRLLITDGDTVKYEARESDDNVSVDIADYKTWRVEIPAQSIRACEQLYIFPGDEVGYSMGQPYSEALSDIKNNSVKVFKNISGVAHDYVLTSSKDADCEQSGYRKYTCSACGAEKTDVTAATGHSLNTEKIAPTCTEKGYTAYTCGKCGKIYKNDFKDALGHSYESTQVPASYSEKAHKKYVCSTCADYYIEYTGTYLKLSKVKSVKFTASASNSVNLSWQAVKGADRYEIYNSLTGKLLKTVKTNKCTLSGISNRSASTLKIRACAADNKGDFTVFKVCAKPAAVKVSSPKSTAKSAVRVKWSKNIYSTGYQVQYSTSANFKGAKTLTISSNKTDLYNVKKLASGKKYYFRVRTYKSVGSTNVFSAWSAAKSVKCK